MANIYYLKHIKILREEARERYQSFSEWEKEKKEKKVPRKILKFIWVTNAEATWLLKK